MCPMTLRAHFIFALMFSIIVIITSFRTLSAEKVVIYGSRAKGTYRSGSDIDFAIFADENINFLKLRETYMIYLRRISLML